MQAVYACCILLECIAHDMMTEIVRINDESKQVQHMKNLLFHRCAFT